MRLAFTTRPAASATPSDRLARLKDPQVWVCAIAAFTLLGLSTGLLGGEPAVPRAALTAASAAPVITVASAAVTTPVKP